MKRIIALIICLILTLVFFNACSDNGGDAETTADSLATANNYIGDGFKENLSLLVESNRIFVEEVFVERTLTVDAENPKKDGLTTYYPVVSDTITSYSSLDSLVYSTYTDETANELLEDNIYKNIDGKLYCKNKHTLVHEKEDVPAIKIEGVSVSSEKCVFNVINEDGSKTEMTAVYDKGTWKLDKIYTEI